MSVAINLMRNKTYEQSRKVRIIVLGSGFAGMAFLKSFLKEAKKMSAYIELILISRRRQHVFTPLLYQVCTGLVDLHHVIDPINTNGYKFIEAEIFDIDLNEKLVKTNIGEFEYDYLIIALGSVTEFFNIEGAQEYSIPLKNPKDAESIRNKIIQSFEIASILEKNHPLRRALLNFVIIGGGATGVELAGSLRDYCRMLEKHYNLEKNEAKVILIEATTRLVSGTSEEFGEKVKKDLESAGIEILLNSKVVKITSEGVVLSNGSFIQTKNVFWAAGIKANPLLEKLEVKKQKGRIIVDEFLRMPDYKNVFVIGDCAWIRLNDKVIPQTAEAAVKEGKYVGKLLASLIKGEDYKAFNFKSIGMMVSLGRFSGVAEIKGKIFSGFLGWLMWRTIHFYKISTIRNKIGVLFDWTFSILKRRIVIRTD